MRPAGNAPWILLAATGLGTILMYLFDPQAGTYRRAVVRDKVRRAAHFAGRGTATTWRDVGNRACGILNEAASLLETRQVSDDVLVERVRSKLGFLVRHPRSIQVEAEQGRVTLSGPILPSEVDDLLRAVRRVKGAVEVVNRLEVHDEPDQVPGLQGDPPRVPRGERFELMQVNWSPAARASAGLTGAALLIYGMNRRNLSGAALGLVGTAMAARAASNLPFTRLTGIAGGRRAVDVNKTLRFATPVERVFAFWSNYRDFPRYTRHVREVLEQGEGRSRWTVVGPAGVEFSWNATITSFIPNQVLAWRTEPDSSVQHAGILKFKDNHDGTTSVHMKLSYNPPLGVVGHGVAKAIGADLESVLEEELVRIKTVLEQHTIPRDVQQRKSDTAPTLKTEQLEG